MADTRWITCWIINDRNAGDRFIAAFKSYSDAERFLSERQYEDSGCGYYIEDNPSDIVVQ